MAEKNEKTENALKEITAILERDGLVLSVEHHVVITTKE